MSAAQTRPRIAWLVNLYGDPKTQHAQAAALLQALVKPLGAVVLPVYCLDSRADAIRGVAPKERVAHTRERLLALLEEYELPAGEPVVLSAGDDPTGKQQAQALATAVENADVMFSLLHTRGQSTIDRVLLGSFSERFLEASRRPMLVLNPSATLPKDYTLIVFGTDLGNTCSNAFGVVLQLASRLKADVRVEHQVVMQELPMFLQGAASKQQHEEEMRAAREDAEADLQPLADEALFADVNTELAIEFEGPAITPGEGLELRAERRGASMIAVAAHGDHRRPGDISSTARWLMRHAQRPVLVIP